MFSVDNNQLKKMCWRVPVLRMEDELVSNRVLWRKWTHLKRKWMSNIGFKLMNRKSAKYLKEWNNKHKNLQILADHQSRQLPCLQSRNQRRRVDNLCMHDHLIINIILHWKILTTEKRQISNKPKSQIPFQTMNLRTIANKGKPLLKLNSTREQFPTIIRNIDKKCSTIRNKLTIYNTP